MDTLPLADRQVSRSRQPHTVLTNQGRSNFAGSYKPSRSTPGRADRRVSRYGPLRSCRRMHSEGWILETQNRIHSRSSTSYRQRWSGRWRRPSRRLGGKGFDRGRSGRETWRYPDDVGWIVQAEGRWTKDGVPDPAVCLEYQCWSGCGHPRSPHHELSHLVRNLPRSYYLQPYLHSAVD